MGIDSGCKEIQYTYGYPANVQMDKVPDISWFMEAAELRL